MENNLRRKHLSYRFFRFFRCYEFRKKRFMILGRLSIMKKKISRIHPSYEFRNFFWGDTGSLDRYLAFYLQRSVPGLRFRRMREEEL